MEGLGFLISLGMDPTEAQDALKEFEQSTGKSFDQVARGLQESDRALLSNHQSVHLLAEELGVHLPRAVVGAVSEMIPNIQMLGGALLGAFAVKEAYEFFEWTKRSIEEATHLADAEKAMAEAAKENLKEFANLSRQQLQMEIMRANVRLASQEETYNRLYSVMEKEIALTGPEGILLRKLFGDDKDLAEAKKTVDDTKQLVTDLSNMLNEGNQDAASEAKKAAKIASEAWERSTEEAYEFWARRREQAQREFDEYVHLSQGIIAQTDRAREAGAAADQALLRGQADMAHADQTAIEEGLARSNQRIREQFRELQASAKRLQIEWANAHPLAANITADLKSMGIAAQGASVAKMELTAVTAQFTRATIEEMMAIQKSLAASGEQLAAGLAGLIGGRRAQAGVEAIWEVARGIAMLAEGSWPPNPAALIAAGLHFEAAAQYGIIAGTGSHRHSGAGAGAGGSGSSGRDYGRSGEGSGSDRMPQTLAQGAAGAGFSVWFRYFSRPWKLRYTCLGSSNGH